MARSYREIREELNREIDELYSKDPYWRKCLSCPLKGKCCKDNDIDIREDEWEMIKDFLDYHPEVTSQVKENFENGKKCYFQTEKCCLLGDLRPLNCLYTPYQLIQNQYTGRITYNTTTDNCDFEETDEKADFYEENKTLVYLEKPGHYYLLLTSWFRDYYLDSTKKESHLSHWYLSTYFKKK